MINQKFRPTITLLFGNARPETLSETIKVTRFMYNSFVVYVGGCLRGISGMMEIGQLIETFLSKEGPEKTLFPIKRKNLHCEEHGLL
jgi:hypothetical protein